MRFNYLAPVIETPAGLSKAQVEQRKSEGKINFQKEHGSKSIVLIIAGNLIDLPNIIIFISMFFLVLYGQGRDALLVSFVIVTNMIVSIFQEVKARNSLRRISFLHKEKVTVIRDNEEKEIDFDEIVQDEVIKLASGKYLYVDGKLLAEEGLLLDESILSGESEYAKKLIGEELLSGSFVVSGIGYYLAEKIGEQSYINKITKEARNYVAYLSPLQQQVNQILKTLTYITIGVISILLSVNVLTGQQSEIEIVNAVVSVINSMIPQGIVLALTISFIIGAVRMAQRKILVQKASTIETLSGISVLCMDKTGTVTENKLELAEFISLGKMELPLEREQLVALYCNYTLEKNKTVLALAKANAYKEKQKVKVLAQLPFTSRSKMSGLDLMIGEKRLQMLLGSLDGLERFLNKDSLSQLRERELKLASLGRRNLFMLARQTPPKKELKIDDHDQQYEALVLLSMVDKLRKNAKSIVLDFINQGIKPVIISGDHPETLKVLANQLQIPNLDNIITGKQLREAKTTHDFDQIVVAADIFARVTPEQKLNIIRSLQKIYQYVAMIGDGVNDALAIKQANLGVAMGSGANVTKNIADVILLDDDIGKLAEVMTEGRIILINTLRSAQLLIVKNIYSLIIILGSILLSLKFPFYPLGLFFLAFTNGTFPVLALLADRPKQTAKIEFMGTLYKFIASSGILAGATGIFILLTEQNSNDPFRTQGLLVGFLILVGIVNYLYSIRNSYNLRDVLSPSKHFLVAVSVFIIYLGAMYIAPISQTLKLYPLRMQDWRFLLPLIGFYFLALSLLGSQYDRFMPRPAKSTGNSSKSRY